MSGQHEQVHLNTDPFHSAGRGDASHPSNTKNGTTELERRPSSRGSPREHSRARSSHHLTALNTVTSAAHAAKEKLHLHSIKATGPTKFFNPTNVRVHVRWHDDDDQNLARQVSSKIEERTYRWRARDNRKGRKSIAVPAGSGPLPLPSSPERRGRVPGS